MAVPKSKRSKNSCKKRRALFNVKILKKYKQNFSFFSNINFKNSLYFQNNIYLKILLNRYIKLSKKN